MWPFFCFPFSERACYDYSEYSMETLLTLGSFVGHLSPVTVLLTSVAILIVLLGTLLIVQLRNNAHLYNLTYPVYDYTVKEAQKRANQIIAEAQEKGRTIIAGIESEASKIVSERSRESEHLMAEYEKRLAELMHKHEVALGSYTGGAEQAFKGLSEGFKRHMEESEKALTHEFESFASHAQETRTHLEEETKRLIAEHLDKEFAAVREGLESYRRERLKRVEDDIVAIMEQAVAIVLRKELSLKDHVDAVHEAFETAKREGVLR